MNNIKSSIVSAMKTATALYTLIADRFYFHYPDNFNTLPCVSYFELNNAGNLFADDVEIGSEIIFQVDVWNTGSTSSVAQAVDTIMVANGFVRVNAVDLFEKDTKMHHKSMKYKNDYADPNF
jgi:hypothetical protein